uniref:Uncharacterized protein n=1 Tax=Anguilla anguilla TaxID=7936 RepID=A0A0E9WP04_ANGAN
MYPKGITTLLLSHCIGFFDKLLQLDIEYCYVVGALCKVSVSFILSERLNDVI